MTLGRWIVVLLVANLVAMAGLNVAWWRRGLEGISVAGGLSEARFGSSAGEASFTNVVYVPVTNAFRWSQLESEDYSTYIRNLRAIGCPEQTIRDIIIADLDMLWAPRIRSIYPRRSILSYWQSEGEELANEYDARELERQERAVDKEKRAVIRDLIGTDLVSERARVLGQVDEVDRRLQFLDLDKRMETRDILENFEEGTWKILERQWEEGAVLTEEERGELRRLREQKEAALDALLSPEERRQYDLWMSPTAEQLRHDFYGMDASEQEFLQVYELRSRFDQAWPDEEINLADPEMAARHEAARQELEAQVKETLGQDRYALYQRGQDEDYHLLNRTVSRYDLDREAANRIYEFKSVLEYEKEQVVLATGLTGQQKEVVLGALQEEARRTVREILGENAANYYLRKTDWLR